MSSRGLTLRSSYRNCELVITTGIEALAWCLSPDHFARGSIRRSRRGEWEGRIFVLMTKPVYFVFQICLSLRERRNSAQGGGSKPRNWYTHVFRFRRRNEEVTTQSRRILRHLEHDL